MPRPVARPSASPRPPLRGAVLALLAGSLLAACGGGGESAPAPVSTSPGAAAAPAAPPEEAPDPAVIAAEKEMVQAVTVGDASAPVDLRFELAEAPRPGRPFTLELAVLPQVAMLSLRGTVTGGAGLEVVAPVDGVQLDKLQAGSIHRFRITALSARPGTRVVNVAMTLELPTGPATRSFGVPVVVPAAAAPTPRA